MVYVSHLGYAYETGNPIRFPDFRVERGEQCLLLGDSGSGKTTLLHLLGGLLKVGTGKIEIGGQDIATLSETARDRFRGKNIGFIFQKNHLISALSVKKNLLMAPFLGGLRQDQKRVEAVLEQLGLREKSDARVSELSQGQAQRVAIARAVLNRPKLILADEPTSALDDRNCARVIDLLTDIASTNGATLLVATHDQRLKSKIPTKVTL